MDNLTSLLEKLRDTCSEVRVRFSFPMLYVCVIDDAFEGVEQGYRLSTVSHKIDSGDLERIFDASGAYLLLLTKKEYDEEYSFLDDSEAIGHWLSYHSDNPNVRKGNLAEGVRVIHFYGQKGGQARSSVLATFARSLADEGHRVLIIDADIEAPTLNILLEIPDLHVESTLMGYSGFSKDLSYTSNPSVPGVSFIGCRPSGDGWEIDHEAFVLRATTDPSVLVHAMKLIEQVHLDSGGFDTVLIDHRTGVANSVIPIVAALPGACVIFSRPDNQTNWTSGIESLLAFYPESPGAFISFSLDHQKLKGNPTQIEDEQKEKCLSILSKVMSKSAEDPESVDPEFLDSYYIDWVYDRAFFNYSFPKLSQLQADNEKSIKQLKEVLDIRKPVASNIAPSGSEVSMTSPSGVVDETWFVESDMTRSVLDNSSSLNYILGRKGTGKSRLFKEAYQRRVGSPLLAPSEFVEIDASVLNSGEALLQSLLKKIKGDYRDFWWCLIYCKLKDGVDGRSYKDYLEQCVSLDHDVFVKEIDPQAIKKHLSRSRQTFIIDGLETVVPANQLKSFVDGLLSCMNVVQSDPDYRSRLSMRLFLRLDLAIGSQNIEQQVSGRKVELSWTEKAQLNYVLASLAASDFMRDNFSDAITTIENNKDLVCSGSLSVEDSEAIMLKIFPEKLKRNNIKTITFIKSYFRDASSYTTEQHATFYPRLFMNFIARLSDKSLAREGGYKGGDGLIDQSLIFEAYEEAARDFMNEAQQEMKHAIDLDDDPRVNEEKVAQFIEALQGKLTPFKRDALVDVIADDMASSVTKDRIGHALHTMKQMGIFEQTPKDKTKWRAGRVYKLALGMKFVR